MSNYTSQNLIDISPSRVPAGTLAIRIGDDVFTAGSVSIDDAGDAYVVVSDSGVLYAQKLHFNGTEASDSGAPQSLQNIKIFNTGHPQPQGGSGGGAMDDLTFFDWMTILDKGC